MENKHKKRRHSSSVRPGSSQVVESLRLSVLSQSVQCYSDLKTQLNEVQKACSDAHKQATSLSVVVSDTLGKVSLLPDGVRRAAELRRNMGIALHNTSDLEVAASDTCESNDAVIAALKELHDGIARLTDRR